MDGKWKHLADAQERMVSQRQLSQLGVTRAEVRHHLRMERWSQRSSSVFSTTTGPLSWAQRLWLGVLHGGPTALIGGLTAARVHGLRNWEREDLTTMRARTEPPLCRIEPAVLLFAGYERSRRTAHGSLADISDGAQSLAEVDVRRACRDFDIAPPQAQKKRRDRSGRLRYTDCEWHLADGRTLVLEVDGAFHDDVMQAIEDRRRNRKLTTRDRLVVTCSAHELRYVAGEVMEDLIALGVPRTC